MNSYQNWAKYVKGLCGGATIFFLALTILFLLQIRTGVNPLIWLSCALTSCIGFIFFTIVNERIAIMKLTGFHSKKELRENIDVMLSQYKKDCEDDSLCDFVSQEMKYLKSDIKQYILIRDLSIRLAEIKTSKQKGGTK